MKKRIGKFKPILIYYTLNLNNITSPSLTTYSLPSSLTNPFSLAAVIVPTCTKSLNAIVSALMNPLSISECILPPAAGALVPTYIVQALTS